MMMLVGLLCGVIVGVVGDRLFIRHFGEDENLIRNEARMLCDRLDRLIVQIKQKLGKDA